MSRTLLAELPELGTLSHKQIAALVGIAPLNHDRGTLRSQRQVWGGCASVRATLSKAALVATKWNPSIRPFLSPPAGGWQSAEGGARRVYAHATDHGQC